MFRFETIVGLVIALSSFSVFGADSDNKGFDYDKQMSAYESKCVDAQGNQSNSATCKERWQYLQDLRGNNTECKDVNALKDKANAARREFHDSCGPAGFPLDNAGSFECAAAIDRCNNCTSTASDNYSDNQCGGEVANDTKEPGFDFGRMERVAKYCPALGANKAKDLEKKLENAQKDKKDAEKKLPEIQKKMVDAQNKAEDEAGKAMDTMTKAQQDLDQDLAEAEKKYSQEKKRIAQEIVELQQQIAQVDDAIRQLILSKSDAELQYNEAIRQTEIACYQSASTTVAKLQADRLSRPFNRGGFKQMLSQVGLSDRASWQRVAEKYYRYCINGAPAKASKKSAKAHYDSALGKANAGIQKFNEQKAALAQQQINKRNGVCNPNAQTQLDFSGQAPQESDSCTAAKEALADGQRAQRKFSSQANKAAAEAARAQKKGQNEAMAAQAELRQLSQQRADEDKRVRNLRRAYEIADGAADKAGPDPKAHDRALEKRSAFDMEAGKYVRCALQKNMCDETCQRLKTYLNISNSGENVTLPASTTPPPLADENRTHSNPGIYTPEAGQNLTDQIRRATH